jgi:hypothetical protein
MIEIREALEAQAQAVVSRADLADVRRRAIVRRRRRTAMRGAIGALVVMAIGVGSAVALSNVGGRNAASNTLTTPGSPAIVALKFDDQDTGPRANSEVNHALERYDAGAEQGPWTVIVRRPDGTLGYHGAVITYPASSAVLERTVDVNGTMGGAANGIVVWPIGDSFARVRGDLDDETMLALARATTVVNGRPVLGSPPVPGLLTVRSAPYRSTSVNEMRYGSSDLGEGGALGNGLAYTDVFTGGGFEDQLYAQGGRQLVDVGSRKAVVSNVGGGNATMAWELEPGLVALVGYSGSASSTATTDALARLVLRTRPLDAAGWSAMAAQVDEQTNDFGR